MSVWMCGDVFFCPVCHSRACNYINEYPFQPFFISFKNIRPVICCMAAFCVYMCKKVQKKVSILLAVPVKRRTFATAFRKGRRLKGWRSAGAAKKIFRKIWRNGKNALTLQTLSLKNGSKIFDMIWIQETQYEKWMTWRLERCNRTWTGKNAPCLSFFLGGRRWKDILQWRVWSWLRMNASYRPNTCKSRGSMGLAC